MPPTYRTLQRYAFIISVISILYCTAEGAVSIALGFDSKSRSLIFFGIQSAIEVASACVVTWRFRRAMVLEEGAERNGESEEEERRNIR